MLIRRWAVLCGIAAILIAFPMSGWATIGMNGTSVSSSGSGNSMGTATITSEGPWDVQEPGFGADATVTPTGTAISFQQSHAIAYDGTANASTSGTITETGSGVDAGDSVTATTAGSTGAAAQKENDPVRATLSNESTARLVAAGGSGGVLSNFFTTTSGFMVADALVNTDSTGSTDATAGNDASGSVKGGATVAYTFAGQRGSETLGLTGADVAATSDVDDDTTVAGPSIAYSEAGAGGVVGWSDNSDLTGWGFGAFLNLDAETLVARTGDQADNGLPEATADAAGDLALNFVFRPQNEFSLVGDVTGSTDSEAAVTQGNGLIFGQGIKAAVGTAGTQTDLPTGALAWLAGNVRMQGLNQDGPDLFDGEAVGHAVNPAVLGEDEPVDPDPAMTVGTPSGAYSAAIGSSSLVNAEVTATGAADEYEDDDALVASAFAFAAAVADEYDTAAVPGVGVYDLAGPYAFVGQGSITAADTGPDGQINNSAATATVLNVFGTASTPTLNGALNNGDSSADIAQDDDLVFQRAASASADSVSGTNYPVAISHNQMFGTFDKDANSPWFATFVDEEPLFGDFDHLAVGFIGGGGD